jgi:hypothetical protein
LADRLLADFRASDGGFASLAELPMPQRAVVSDQIVGAAQAVPRNLLEARLHEADVNALLVDGVALTEPTFELHEASTRTDMHVVGFFRGVGSTLDCLAAAAIGVARLPLSIRRAGFSHVMNLSAETAAQQEAWVDLKALVDHHAGDPQGWLRWTLEMRHALMHRPRLMSLNLPREAVAPRLALPAWVARQVMRERLRFDPHFRRRPWLPDMQHLADPYLGSLPEAVIAETATQTIRGVFEATNRLTEDMASMLVEMLDDPVVAAIPPPETKWALEDVPDAGFAGFAPVAFPADMSGIISAADAERIRLAAALHGAGHVDGDAA